MSAKHTPAPWTIGPRKNAWRNITTQAGEYIAEVETDPDAPDESAANARLIAAAPNLLVALQEVTKLASDLKPVCDCGGEQTGSPEQSGRHNADCAIGIILDARAAIAKAVQS